MSHFCRILQGQTGGITGDHTFIYVINLLDDSNDFSKQVIQEINDVLLCSIVQD